MAVTWGSDFPALYANRAILAAMGGSFAITIYGGTKPNAADFVTNFASYNSGNAVFLAHYAGAALTQSGSLLPLTLPAAVNASNTGTGVWVVLWSTNPALGSMGGAIPTTTFILADVSDTGGSGVVRFSSLSFTSGVSKAIFDGSIAAALV